MSGEKYVCRHGKIRSEHWCDDHDDHAAPTPEPSEVAETKTGERECGAIPPNVGGPVPCHLPSGHDGEHFSTSGCKGSEIRWTPAEPDAGEMDALAVLTEHSDCRPTTDGGETRWSCGLVTTSEAFPVSARMQRDHVAVALAALLDRVRRKEGERIAKAIEELPTYYVQGRGNGWLHAVRTEAAASIARGDVR